MNGRPQPLCLVGPRGSGKTTVGRALARAAGRPFCDLDDELAHLYLRDEERSGRTPERSFSAGELLVELGEPRFRRLEERALVRVLARADRPVVATGGGVIESAANRRRLVQRATCVMLDVPVPVLRQRLALDPTFRPALSGDDPIEEVETVLRHRDPLYVEVASLVIDAAQDGPEVLARRILEELTDR